VHGRFPYAGPPPEPRPAMAGIRKPSRERSFLRVSDNRLAHALTSGSPNLLGVMLLLRILSRFGIRY
jgi:hypothetical protein